MWIAVRCAIALLLLGVSTMLRAQPAPRSVAVDLGLGVGQGLGGASFPDRDIVAWNLTAALSVRPTGHGTLLAAVHASAYQLLSTSDCVVAVGNGPSTCATFPSYETVGLLGGWSQRADQGGGLRVLVGPAYVNATETRSGVGLVARLDATQRLSRHVGFVFFGEGVLPRITGGERLAVVVLGVGLRRY